MKKSDTIYHYKKIKPLDKFRLSNDMVKEASKDAQIDVIIGRIDILKNKLNETLIELNKVNKDFELYKKAYKKHYLDFLEFKGTQQRVVLP